MASQAPPILNPSDIGVDHQQNPAVQRLEAIFANQKAAYAAAPYPDRATRAKHLDALINVIEQNEDSLIAAINADFGNRADSESILADITVAIAAARHAKRCLARWMRPKRVATPLVLAPARARIEPQPLGVVGVIGPWNYPLALVLEPAAAALAAGNRVIIKPSELTPKTSALLAELVSEAFEEDVLAVVTGDADVGAAFAATPFDHLFFTGSTAVGHKIARAAAENLTPVTLELGGKSPAVIDDSADLPRAARAIAHGKLFNAGQTCVAPDYVLAPLEKVDAVADAIAAAARDFFPSINDTPDYTAIISSRHFDRLQRLVAEAENAGAKTIELGAADQLKPSGKLPLTLVINPSENIALMKEEIFGPILPIIGLASAKDAITRINDGERPLALYWFGEDMAACDAVLKNTVSGGVCVNDTLLHAAHPNLPFGGVGASGMGSYHGKAGFDAFSHMKSVLQQSRFAQADKLRPPYTDKTRSFIRIVRKFL